MLKNPIIIWYNHIISSIIVCSPIFLTFIISQLGMASALETLCGQAYGAKQYSMIGTYLQRSWLVLLAFAVLLAPTYIFSGQLLIVLGQPAELSREAGLLSMYMLPLHFMFAIQLPLNKFLQCQRKNWVIALSSVLGFPVHVVATWLLVQCFQLGVLGAAMSLNLSWALITGLQLAYAIRGFQKKKKSSRTRLAVGAQRRGGGSHGRHSWA
jgi:MATE family multidrug resistance protein